MSHQIAPCHVTANGKRNERMDFVNRRNKKSRNDRARKVVSRRLENIRNWLGNNLMIPRRGSIATEKLRIFSHA